MRCLTCHEVHEHHCPHGINVLNHERLVKKLVKRYNHEYNEDAYHDAIVFLLSHKCKYNATRSGESTFVYWVVRSFFFNKRRQQNKLKTIQLTEDHVTYTDTTHLFIEFKEEAERLRSKLTTDNQREIVDMYYYQGLSLKDAARLLGVPHATAKGRHQWAMSLMRGT